MELSHVFLVTRRVALWPSIGCLRYESRACPAVVKVEESGALQGNDGTGAGAYRQCLVPPWVNLIKLAIGKVARPQRVHETSTLLCDWPVVWPWFKREHGCLAGA